ncbi:MAG: hypothetical protein SNJ77_09625 [Cytophagales bacterium]
MDEFKSLLFYALAAFVYYLFSSRKKKSNVPQPEAKPQENTPKYDTVGELLEEMKKRQREAELKQHKKQAQPVQNRTQTQTKKYSSDYAASGLEENQRRLREIEDKISEAQKRNRIDYEIDSFEVEDSKIFKDKPKAEKSYYSKILQNPKSVKDAIILSEILQRKEY